MTVHTSLGSISSHPNQKQHNEEVLFDPVSSFAFLSFEDSEVVFTKVKIEVAVSTAGSAFRGRRSDAETPTAGWRTSDVRLLHAEVDRAMVAQA